MLCSEHIQSFHENRYLKSFFEGEGVGADFHSITVYGISFRENVTDTGRVFYTQKKNC
jgi:hypothetical protein